MSSQPSARSIRVLLITSDPDLRGGLEAALKTSAFQVAEVVADAASATEACQKIQPDIAVVDAAMPGGEGFSAVQDIMAFRPTPILVLTDAADSAQGFQALSLGALDVMARPRGLKLTEDVCRDFCGRLKLLAGVRVITHVKGRHSSRPKSMAVRRSGPPVVGIAASLGGPKALAVLMSGLPRDLPAPVCLVQHISDGFAKGLAHWLASESGMTVREARNGDVLVPGRVLVAPSGAHLTVGENDEVVLDTGPAVEGFRPSATAMFNSLAQHYGPRVIGVVLTGMGRDGANGLTAIRAAGGRTLAQDEATSVVYGMPRAAVEVGAVERVLPLEDLAAAIVTLVRDGVERADR